MSNYKLNFKLRQHTPIIHFQWDQEGATLRASEVKPKLDKFLIKKAFGGILNFEKYKKFLIGDIKSIENELQRIDKDIRVTNEKKEKKKEYLKKQHLAFDYKVKVKSNGKEFVLGFPRKKWIKENGRLINYELVWDNQFPNYFGNMKKKGEYKKPKNFRFSNEHVVGMVVCFNTELKLEIIKHFQDFFFENNFGARQNKGFGSFGLIELNEKKIDLKQEYVKKYPSFEVNLSTLTKDDELYYRNNDIGLPTRLFKFKAKLNKDFESLLNSKKYKNDDIPFLFKQHNLFYRIELYYKTLRSGINLPNKLYFKSFMFQYAKSLNPSQQWDKRTMRESFYLGNDKYKKVLANRDESAETLKYIPSGNHKKDKLLFRDLLGLSSLQQWKYYNDDTITKEGVAKVDNKVKVERFKSPITFKPIQIYEDIYQIFILTNESVEQILNEPFMINSNNNHKSIELRIPDTFKINNYLKSCATDYILQDSKSFDESFKEYVNNSNSQESRYLLDIYTQLNKFYKK